jgi:hypothetical protein
MSVTRATTATRVNSAGLVELVPYNLVTYSQDFTTDWVAYSGTTVTANATTAPDGTLTADRITGASGAFRGVRQTCSVNTDANTFSVYLKSATGSTQNIRIWNDATSSVITLTTEWQRFTLTSTATSNSIQVQISTAISSSIDVYAWGAQLVEGSTAKDYQKTETRLNIPRLDYSNGTCPSLLVEPQRTNLTLYSSSFDNAAWTKSNTTATANTIISPSGIQDADSVAETTATNSHELSSNAITFLASTKYTATLYAKWDSACTRNIHIRFGNCPSVNIGASFDKNGNFVNYTGGSNGTLDSYSATDVGNGWWKFVITITTAAVSSSGQGLYVYYMDGTTLFYTGNTSQVINFWGAQLEAGSYATSYIPTTSASVTRNADVISKTGISSLIGQTEGTFFVDVNLDETSDFNGWFLKENATFDTFVFLQRETSGRIAAGYYGSGALQARIETAPNQPIGHYKIAFGYKNNDFVMYINGTQIGTDTSGSVSGLMDYIDLHWTQTGTNHQHAVALWKTRLTNTQLAQLTTI